MWRLLLFLILCVIVIIVIIAVFQRHLFSALSSSLEGPDYIPNPHTDTPPSSKINLFIEYYQPKDEVRKQEIDFVFKHNISLPEIDQMYIIVHSEKELQAISQMIPKSRNKFIKIVVVSESRPTYGQLYSIIDKYTLDDDINVLSNSDIAFDSTISTCRRLRKEEALALARWNLKEYQLPLTGTLERNPRGSQDVWVVRGHPHLILKKIDFTTGVPYCDQRLAYILSEEAKYKLFNPCYTIKIYHAHKSDIRYYGHDERVEGNLKKLYPCFFDNPNLSISCDRCGKLDPENLEKGRKEMLKHKVVICGISRDNAKELPLTLIEQTGKMFNDYRVIIFENDSTDGTKKILQNWSEGNSRVKILSKDYHNRKRPSIQFLAECRNHYIQELEQPEYKTFDLMMAVDMDMKYGWDFNGLKDSFSKIGNWDGVGSNGIFTSDGKMWDMFAFRNDEFHQKPNTPNYFRDIVPKGQKHYCVGSSLIPVESCFGGLAIYKRKYLNNCRYSSLDGDCEHINFHEQFRKNGGRMFMNPSQITYYSHFN